MKPKIDRIIEILTNCNENSTYKRFSDESVLDISLGKNEEGFYSFRFSGSFKPKNLVGNETLKVKQFKSEDRNILMFCCTSQKSVQLFYKFCEDIFTIVEHCPIENAYEVIVKRFNEWRRFFKQTSSILSEIEMMGLIGELVFLKSFCFGKYGINKSLIGWSGVEKTHKDFTFFDCWYEIKTKTNYKDLIRISSLEQLDSNQEGRLVVYTFDKLSQIGKGLSLNKLIEDISKIIQDDDDKDLFFKKLDIVGYAYSDEYDNFNYKILAEDKYIVDDNFPKIKLSALPSPIRSVSYEISMSAIDIFKE